jgi:hypothetical protein
MPSPATAILVFTAIDGILRQEESEPCCDARTALDLLRERRVPVVLMSHGAAAPVQALQAELGLVEPFICDGGATLYIPRGYFEELDGLAAGDDSWEVFHFGVREPARAVRLLGSLYSVRGEDILTIGFGCRWVDRSLLAAVNVSIIVRDGAGEYDRLLRYIPGAYLTSAAGPAGWTEAVLGAAPV